MKTGNFPEKKRQRQLGALARLLGASGNPKEIKVLQERTAVNLRDVRTKKAGNRKGR